jgi:uncharacterized protein YhdP
MSDQKEFADLPVAGQSKLGGRAALVLSRALKVLLILVAVVYFAVAGIYLALRYVVMPQVDAFRPRIEQLVSSKIHAQMRIGRINAQWSGLEPTFDIDNLRIDALDGTPGLAVPHASATIAWHSLVHLAPVLSNLTVDGPDVMIARAADGSLSVAGVPIPARRNGNNAFLTWLLSQEAIVLRDGTLLARRQERRAGAHAQTHQAGGPQRRPATSAITASAGGRRIAAWPARFPGRLRASALHGHRPLDKLDGPRVFIDGTGGPANARALRQRAVLHVWRPFR